MRIPLDYYQILGVTIQASAQQLEQAYSDRLLQEPRREYNKQAIQARQELIQHAYQVLSDSEQKAAYDAQFFVNMQSVETAGVPAISETAAPATEVIPENSQSTAVLTNPTIEIASSQLLGALLIFHEFGEYELALKLGIDFYNSQEFTALQRQQDEETRKATQENIILALALAYLELGREQWHQNEYENAALSDQLGLDLLKQENLFPQIQEELELDLYKLRPYRVLELISQNPVNSPERSRGFELLREMLLQRQGIEGKGEDLSGLSFDQFLCFIQQLRTYLTSAEQQQLFDSEAQSDSAIANYLAVYALLGRGFSLKQPELVLRAQRKLDLLSDKQDVAWEQAVSALLLGHTEKAIKKLQSSQDTSKLLQVQQHSPESIDLLPGICFYSEKWLQEDVLAQFIDLVGNPLTLKEYFAEREVQKYLEELVSATALAMANPSNSLASQSKANTGISHSKIKGTGILSRWRSIFSSEKTATAKTAPSNQIKQSTRELAVAGVSQGGSGTATLERNHSLVSQTTAKPKHRPKTTRVSKSRQLNSQTAKSPSLPLKPPIKTPAVPPAVQKTQNHSASSKKRHVARKHKSNPAIVWKGWLFILSLILGVGTIGFIGMKLFLNPASKTANPEIAKLAIAVSQPTVELPTAPAKPVAVKPKVTLTETSKQVIQEWLTSKSAAFGKEHQIEQLNNILAEPLLTTWRERAVAYQQGDLYREYEHQITMRSAKLDPQDANKAIVEAEIKEVAQHYQSGQLDQTQSYNDNLLVRYQLIRKGDNWLIQNAEVLKTL
ncbi:MAG: IMS domain-containing protein [Waterburya sp.]